jgi:DNA-binding PadR family transcriptional regulator
MRLPHDAPDRRTLWLADMRHRLRGGRGFSRHGGGFGGGDDGFSRGRKFSSEDLQLLLIALLADAPRHGYELIKMLETRSNGFYAPSPGMVYPSLTYLEEIGYTSIAVEGNRKSYSLTAEGRAYLEANRERIEMIWAKLNFLAKKMGLVRRALAGEGADDEPVGRSRRPEFMYAFHELKTRLFEPRHMSAEEQLRIAKVLERAAAEISCVVDAPKDN